MAYNVTFGEYNLQDYCTVLNVTRSLLPPRTNFSKQVISQNGSYYTGFRYGERVITLDVALITQSKTEYMAAVSNLAEILNVRHPEELIIDDEPYKLYLAVPNGEINLQKFATTGRCEIQFLCNDPAAYSTYWNTYSPYSNKIFKVTSYGNVETYPIIDVDFNSKACFFQLTNPRGQTVLIGKPRRVTYATQNHSDIALNDDCTLVTTFNSLSPTLLDMGRQVTGNYGVGLSGSGIVCTNFGTAQDNMWTGAAFKREITTGAVSDFEVTIDATFSSKGQNWVAPPPETPKPQPPAPAPPSKPSNPTTTPSTPSLGTWKVVNCGGLWINAGPSTASPLYAMAPGTYIYPTEIIGKWMKHTHSNRWNTFTGWSSKNYLQKVSDSVVPQSVDFQSMSEDNMVMPFEYADEQMGLMEVYGYDQNGAKLFKFEISDTSAFYEYVDPKVYIGNTLVLQDNKNLPTPRKEKIKDSNGKVTGEKDVDSGVFGDFNDFVGKLTISRETNSKGTQLWTCSINKIVEGKVVSTLRTANTLTNSAYPTGSLAYIGCYIGRYGSATQTTEMGIQNITVKRLNFKTDDFPTGNVAIFDGDDHMQIDFSKGLVTVNHKPILTLLDVGSEFFSLPPGQSQFAYATDDTSARVICGFRDKFI